MAIVNFLLFLIAGVGITNLVVNASILDIPRDFIIKEEPLLGKLVTCMMCSGFWIGLLMGIFSGVNPIYAGAAISVLSYTYEVSIEYIEILSAVQASKIDSIEIAEEDE
jgi:hypothetical protein